MYLQQTGRKGRCAWCLVSLCLFCAWFHAGPGLPGRGRLRLHVPAWPPTLTWPRPLLFALPRRQAADHQVKLAICERRDRDLG